MRKTGGLGGAVLVACLSGLTTIASAAGADARNERAREHYHRADAYFKVEKYGDALQEFKEAYLEKPDPTFLYNIAQCHRLMGSRVEALRFYRRYLGEATHVPNRAVAERHVKDLEASLAASPAANGTAAGAGSATGAPPPGAPPAGEAASGVPPSPSPQSQSPPSPPTGADAAPAQPGSGASPGAGPLLLDAPSPPPAGDAPPAGVGAAPGAPGRSAGGLFSVERERRQGRPDERPLHGQWWLWVGVGAVIVGGTALALLAGGDPGCPMGRMCQ